MNSFYPIKEYVKFLPKSINQYGIHSEFVYDLLINALYKKKDKKYFQDWKTARKSLLNNHKSIEIKDLGAGSKVFSGTERKISALAKTAGASSKKARILQNIVLHRQPQQILELGTSLGLGSLAMSLPKVGELTTVEACPNTLKVARDLFQEYQVGQVITIENVDFDTYLDRLEKKVHFDLVIIDGNHTYEATWHYFKKLSAHLHTDSLLVLDDLYWSKGMTQAWNEICQSEKISISIDTFELGFLFFRTGIEKQHFMIRI